MIPKKDSPGVIRGWLPVFGKSLPGGDPGIMLKQQAKANADSTKNHSLQRAGCTLDAALDAALLRPLSLAVVHGFYPVFYPVLAP
jgi:hypothetical protein